MARQKAYGGRPTLALLHPEGASSRGSTFGGRTLSADVNRGERSMTAPGGQPNVHGGGKAIGTFARGGRGGQGGYGGVTGATPDNPGTLPSS